MRQLIILFLLLLFFVSCNTKYNTQNVEFNDIPSSTLKLTDSFPMNEILQINDIYVIDQYVLISNTNPAANYLFYLYDKKSGQFKGSYVNYGKANNEAFWLNPNYLYSKNDTIFVNTNNFKESAYKIDSSGISQIYNDRIITNQVYMTFEKIGDNKFIAQDENSEKEYIISNIEGNVINKIEIGDFPEYYSSNFEELMSKHNFHQKHIVSLYDNVYSFYIRFPLIRKYNNEMNLIKEVQIGELPNFSEKEKLRAFARSRIFNNNIYTIFYSQEKMHLVVFDMELNPIIRYEIKDKIRGFAVDENFAYFYTVIKDVDYIMKYSL